MVTELQNYLERIEDLRGQMVKLLTGLPADVLNWRPTDAVDDHATNSLAVMATHAAGAEHFWMAEVVGRRPATRNRDAEFQVQATDASQLVALLEKTGVETREIFAALQPTDLDGSREVRGETVPVRWSIVHVIDHTALHLGHMQLTYQLWRGGQGIKSPRWFDRLPGQD